MASSTHNDIQVGDTCEYLNISVVVLAVNNDLGFRTFKVMNMDNGETFFVHKYQIKKKFDSSVVFPKQEDDDRNDECVTDEHTDQVSERFLKRSEDDLHDIESHTKAKATHTQTKWGVKIFQGNCLKNNICFYYKVIMIYCVVTNNACKHHVLK